MRKSAYILFAVLAVVLTSFSVDKNDIEPTEKDPMFSFDQYAGQLYECVNDEDINLKAFNIALKGYYILMAKGELENERYLTIIDMSLSANKERFYVIDMETQELVYKSLVAHGKNTGEEFAYNFSNTESSYQTSIGFYKTAETYDGKRGYSLKLDGLEYSNSQARDRGIIIHGADYVSEKFITENGRLGRSLGCPTLPMETFEKTVDYLKEGSCLFIYFPQSYYLRKSKLVNGNANYLLTSSGMLADLD